MSLRLLAGARLLDTALEAASRASCDAGTHEFAKIDAWRLNEQWTHSYVGIAINDAVRSSSNSTDLHVTFETRVDWIDDFHGVEMVNSVELSAASRFDITVWGGGQKIAGLVEIKDEPVMGTDVRLTDCRRLIAALDRWPSLKWGMFLFSVRVRAYKTRDALTAALTVKSDTILAAIRAEVGSLNGSVIQEGSNSACLTDGGAMLWTGIVVGRS